jgi:uncharacterized membrane protein YcaP (DUF421 family)
MRPFSYFIKLNFLIMMDIIHSWWGTYEAEPGIAQMGLRAMVAFIFAIALLRISGRRSFGLKSPFDNTIAILLGAILAKGVIGEISFLSALVACLVLAVAHRFFAWLALRFDNFGGWIKGERIKLFENGKLFADNMKRSLVSENDLMERLRLNGCESLDEIKLAYMERSGEISVIRKLKAPESDQNR